MSDRREDLSAFARRIDAKEAIFCTSSRPVARVRTTAEVHRQSTDAEGQKGYLQIKSEVIPTPGLRIVAGSKLPVFGASRDILQVTGNYVTASYTDMEFFFDPDFIETIVAMVAELPPGKTVSDDYTSRPATKPMGKFSVINSPGPVASRVYDYISEYRWSAPMGDPIRLNNR